MTSTHTSLDVGSQRSVTSRRSWLRWASSLTAAGDMGFLSGGWPATPPADHALRPLPLATGAPPLVPRMFAKAGVDPRPDGRPGLAPVATRQPDLLTQALGLRPDHRARSRAASAS